MTNSHADLLISRIVDGEATVEQWRDFETQAQAEPALWRQLAHTQRDDAGLEHALTAAAGVADATPLHAALHATPLRFNRLGAWTGWAVAAMVAIIATAQHASFTGSSGTGGAIPTQLAGVPFPSVADAWQAYLQKGRESGAVVGEIPNKVLIETKPAVSGNGIEVIYLRQVMERAIVPDLYQFSGQDETGRPTLIRYEQPVRRAM